MAKKNWEEETEKNVQGVVNAKSSWQAAYDEGNEEGMNAAHEAAKRYYKSLTDSGNYDVAKELQESDYEKAKGYLDSYKETKPVDTNRGMANENVRTATDAAKDHSGFANTAQDMWKQGYQNQEDRINTDPMSTDAAKSIMARYSGLGENAAKDAYADGSVRNDGNLDSFSKANGDRQREAYETAGVESVFDLHERNVEAGGQNYRDMLGGISIVGDEYDGAVKNANDTAANATDIENANKQSDVNVQAQEADITGEVLEALVRKNNIYFDDNGELINPDLDYQAIINDAVSRGDTEEAEAAEFARAWKIINVPGYSQYAVGMKTPATKKTQAAKEFDENVRVQDKQIDTNAQIQNKEIDTNAQIQNKQIDVNADVAREEINASAQTSKQDTAAELYVQAANLEAKGFPKVAKVLRAQADSLLADAPESEAVGTANSESEAGATEGSSASAGTGNNEEVTEESNQLPGNEASKSGLNKAEIIRKINSTTTDEQEREALYEQNGITEDDLKTFYNL